MKKYCASCKKYTANENSSARQTRQNRLMLLSTFIKNQELPHD